MPLNPDAIRARRIALGMSQDEAAKAIGMVQSAWIRLEWHPPHNPSLRTLEAAARLLGVTVNDLLLPADQAPPTPPLVTPRLPRRWKRKLRV